MSEKPMLKLDWCSHAAAKYAVEHWHYARVMPKSKLAKIGVWEDRRFIGAIVFGVGANANLSRPYDLRSEQVCELLRVALTKHALPVTRMLAISIAFLRKAFPGLRVIVSYADPLQGHVGRIYQAGNWLYTGWSVPTGGREYYVRGRWRHARALFLRYGTRAVDVLNSQLPGTPSRTIPRRYKYVMPLDAAMRAQIAPLAQLYPKRATSILADASPDHGEESGAAPTVALATG